MAKSSRYLVVAVLALALFAGCAATSVSPVPGVLYTDVRAASGYPVGEIGTWEKMGSASCTSILGLIATGDSSVEAALADGRITKIHHVDYEGSNILGIIATYTTLVYGE